MPETLTSTDSSFVLREDQSGIAILTLNRPEKRNPLSEGMLKQLTEILNDINDDPAVRVVILSHTGPSFSAGHDLKEVRANQSSQYYNWLMNLCSNLMLSIVRLQKPVIAAVEGVATAAGCQLVASCDLAIAGENASFSTPGVNIGLFCSTPMVALSSIVASKHALEMLLTGDPIDEKEAARIGLINRAVAAGAASAEAYQLALKIASKSAMTLRIGKEAFYRQQEMQLDVAYSFTSEVMTTNLMAEDAGEGIDAFIEKRSPQWKDR
jgi:enoyl-CoA hydratase/carnithine racemase